MRIKAEIPLTELQRLAELKLATEKKKRGKFTYGMFESEAGLPKDSVRKLLEGRQPMGEKYVAFMKYLCEGTRLLFVLKKGGVVQELEHTDERIVPLPPNVKPNPNLGTIVVEDDSFSPRYFAGDVLFFHVGSKSGFEKISSRHARICMIHGDGIKLAFVRPGSQPGTYTLATPDYVTHENVVLEWCSKIVGTNPTDE